MSIMTHTIITTCIILTLIVVILYFYSSTQDKREYVLSSLDNKYYLVNDDIETIQRKTADTLARMNSKLHRFVSDLQYKYPQSARVKRLRNFDTKNIVETGVNERLTAYTLNKGQEMSLCLQSKNSVGGNNEPNFLYDINLLTYVSIHELAHVMSISTGHNEEFYDNFKFLLEEATKMHVYEKIDYTKNPTNYCGIVINEKII